MNGAWLRISTLLVVSEGEPDDKRIYWQAVHSQTRNVPGGATVTLASAQQQRSDAEHAAAITLNGRETALEREDQAAPGSLRQSHAWSDQGAWQRHQAILTVHVLCVRRSQPSPPRAPVPQHPTGVPYVTFLHSTLRHVPAPYGSTLTT